MKNVRIENYKPDDPNRFGFINGVQELKPIIYTVREVVTGPWFWRRKQWFIESEFVSIGPIFKVSEVTEMINDLNL